ncbi:putative Complex 1 protein (LYR family) [Trypanosoma cruzi]|nr:putative Complex 1 protein (LYR family) [Trypanosoma cruzi]
MHLFSFFSFVAEVLLGFMLRIGICHFSRQEPQVIGTSVPSFRHFPYRAQDVLHLYRDFLRLIHQHPPQERADLLFRLHNEFYRRRHLTSPKMITGAIKRGEGILNVQRSMLESKTLRARGVSSREQGAQNVDGLWDQLQMLSGHVLPGLRNFRPSRNVLKGSYTQQATTQAVYSRRRL